MTLYNRPLFMKYSITIPQTKSENDLTIIYKRGRDELHELKSSKVEFFRTLRYFNQKKQTDLIYIQENVSFEIFEKFILSIIDKKVEIEEDCIPQLYYLCKKYEYEEFLSKIEEITKDKPNILTNSSYKEMNKEEIISKNIEKSIQNGFLNTIPLKKLVEVLKSQKSEIKDHHLLFSFIVQTIQKYQQDKIHLSENDKQNLMILPTFLDFRKLTNEEIEELFEIENDDLFFNPQNSKERIQDFISKEKETEKLSKKIDEIERKFQNQIENLKDEIQLIKKQKTEDVNNMNDQLLIEKVKNDEENRQMAIKQLQMLFKPQKQIFQQNEEEEEEASENSEEEEERKDFIVKLIEVNENNELNGIINYLTNESGGNPHDNGTIEVTSNSICSPFCHPKNLLNSAQEEDYLPKSSELNAWVLFDFKNCEIQISKYSLKSSNFSIDYGHLKNWVIEVSNNAKKWIVIDEHSNCSDLNGPNIIKTYEVKKNNFYRYCRFRNTGDYWGVKEKWGIQFNSIEFYGQIRIRNKIFKK